MVKNNITCSYCNPSKISPSSYPNQISVIEGIIKVSTFCDDFLDCFSKEKLTNFIIGYFDPFIECNILRDENGKEKHTIFNAFHSEMIATYDTDMSFCNVISEEDGIYIMFRLQFNVEIGGFLKIPIEFLERFVKIEKNSYIHLHSSKDGVVTLEETKNYD
ncbi:MAG: hypothetical protein IJD58_11515 [Lachnospiraceae bacterium]|nr:hypothetical protein [Lachnospiraceae bacterium]